MLKNLLKVARIFKPERGDLQHTAPAIAGSLLGKLAKKILPHGLGKPTLDSLGKKKLLKSGGLLGAAVLIVNLLVGLSWYPDAWTDPESTATITAGIAWLLNLGRKLFVRYAPAVLVEELT